MWRIEFRRRLEEASCGRRDELLNRWSEVRFPAPAPVSNSDLAQRGRRGRGRIANVGPGRRTVQEVWGSARRRSAVPLLSGRTR